MATEYTREQQAFSRACIQEALFLLMQDHPLDDITISAIAERSGISRMGFYRNYKAKTDVLNDYFHEEMTDLIKRLTELDTLTADIVIRMYFEHVHDHGDRFKLAIDAGGDYVFFDTFVSTVSSFLTNNIRRPWFNGPYAEYWQQFITAGVYAITIHWIKEDFKTPIDTLMTVTGSLAAQPPRDASTAVINSDDEE